MPHCSQRLQLLILGRDFGTGRLACSYLCGTFLSSEHTHFLKKVFLSFTFAGRYYFES